MFLASIERFEAGFFSALNGFLEPLIRAGLGAPGFSSVGAIVIETRGRKTGGCSNVPLMAALVGDLVVVSTARRRSSWVRNLAARPDIRYWLRGREREASALVIGPGMETPNDLPARVSCLASMLKQHSSMFGTGFAILMPRESQVNPINPS